MSSKNSQAGFKSLQLRFSSQSVSHEIFLKEHSTRLQEPNKPAGRTLFALNIPPYATEDSLKNAFSIAGKVTCVIIQSSVKPDIEKTENGFKVAYIVFGNRESMLKALKLNALNCLSTENNPLETGLKKWIQEYNETICNPNILQKNVTNFMEQFDKLEQKKSKKENEETVDDEGWTVVTKKGRNPGVARKESVEIKLSNKIKANTKKKELTNFYRFQIRENKMKNLALLRKNYEEAKKKVSLMKSARRFKPY